MGRNKPPSGPRTLSGIKSSVLSRGFSLAKLSLNAGVQMAGRSLSELWKDREGQEQRWKDFLAGQARVFSEEIGELKGSLMKAGQALSMYGEHFFPPEVNQFLKTLQHDSPPLEWSVLRRTLVDELGEEKIAELEIEEAPVASASLGQVHRARVRGTGELLALKIQYPDVDRAIESDLRALRRFVHVLKLVPNDFDMDPLFQEIGDMLRQETDYRIEAEWTEKFAARLTGDERYVVPRVIRSYSTKKVLATTFEEGVRIDDPLIQSLSQERRNRLGESFLDLYFRELFDWRWVQTDPHAGNYRVRLAADGRDRIVLLDFGATREYPPGFIEPYRRMIEASAFHRLEDFRRAALELRFLQENDDPRLRGLFEELCFTIIEPFMDPADPRHGGGIAADGSFDWKDTDLPQRTSRKALEILRGFPLRSPPKEILFLDRKTGGVFILLSILRVRINARHILLKNLG